MGREGGPSETDMGISKPKEVPTTKRSRHLDYLLELPPPMSDAERAEIAEMVQVSLPEHLRDPALRKDPEKFRKLKKKWAGGSNG